MIYKLEYFYFSLIVFYFWICGLYIEYKKQDEEIALTLKGKKKNLTRNMLVDYFGKERCELTSGSIDNILGTISSAIPEWKKTIDSSFLSKEMKGRYHELLERRLHVLKLL